ncbi:MAG: glycosyltransferase [Planctomycetia bacterium]|nr:glycosyltransferase [Planctomycetia bacterium]
MENILCMKWGTRYSSEYVNTLASMVRRNMERPYRLVCFTERPEGIVPDVEIRPLPEMELDARLPERGWRKLTMFQEKLADIEGTALFLDLDVVILGSLDPFFDVPGRFRIVEDWNLRNRSIGNSSVFRFEVGQHPDILRYYVEHGDEVRAAHRNEQAYLSWCMKEKGILDYWDPAWCKSFKRHCMRTFPMGYFQQARHPGPETKVVIFHGKPNPDQVWNGWHASNFLRSVRKTDWITENYR